MRISNFGKRVGVLVAITVLIVAGGTFAAQPSPTDKQSSASVPEESKKPLATKESVSSSESSTGPVTGKRAVDNSFQSSAVPPKILLNRLYKHTTSQGTTCCATCNEIGSNGGCSSWSQCVSGATGCDVF